MKKFTALFLVIILLTTIAGAALAHVHNYAILVSKTYSKVYSKPTSYVSGCGYNSYSHPHITDYRDITEVYKCTQCSATWTYKHTMTIRTYCPFGPYRYH